MIEIALSLAVIGFALVAIIGILPTGMGVQKDNRQETIINQDANMFLDALRNGQAGLDDLTNYVLAITNSMTEWDISAAGVISSNAHFELAYTYTNTTRNGALTDPQYLLTNGCRIVGLLSTPRLVWTPRPGATNTYLLYSNYVVAAVRSMSGPASEKYPQTNTAIQDFALSYRMISEILPYQEYDTNWVNLTTGEILHTNLWRTEQNLSNNLHNVRLIFRWPLYPNGGVGNGRQVFRTMASGTILQTNEAGLPPPQQRFLVPTYPLPPHDVLYFFQPRTYARVQ